MVEFDDNIKLVYFVYHRYFKATAQSLRDDLFQEGLIALFYCCQQFDSAKKIKFSTYATKGIYNNMLSFLQKANKTNSNIISFSELSEEDITFGNNLKNSEDIIEKIYIQDIVENYFKTIQKRDRKIILEYYRGNTTMEKIGERFGLSKNAISKITSKFRKTIKERL